MHAGARSTPSTPVDPGSPSSGPDGTKQPRDVLLWILFLAFLSPPRVSPCPDVLNFVFANNSLLATFACPSIISPELLTRHPSRQRRQPRAPPAVARNSNDTGSERLFCETVMDLVSPAKRRALVSLDVNLRAAAMPSVVEGKASDNHKPKRAAYDGADPLRSPHKRARLTTEGATSSCSGGAELPQLPAERAIRDEVCRRNSDLVVSYRRYANISLSSRRALRRAALGLKLLIRRCPRFSIPPSSTLRKQLI